MMTIGQPQPTKQQTTLERALELLDLITSAEYYRGPVAYDDELRDIVFALFKPQPESKYPRYFRTRTFLYQARSKTDAGQWWNPREEKWEDCDASTTMENWIATRPDAYEISKDTAELLTAPAKKEYPRYWQARSGTLVKATSKDCPGYFWRTACPVGWEACENGHITMLDWIKRFDGNYTEISAEKTAELGAQI